MSTRMTTTRSLRTDDRQQASIYVSQSKLEEFKNYADEHGMQLADALERAFDEFMKGTRDDSLERRQHRMEDDISEMREMLEQLGSGGINVAGADESSEEDLVREVTDEELEADDDDTPQILDTLASEGDPLSWNGLKETEDLVDEYGEQVKLHPSRLRPDRVKQRPDVIVSLVYARLNFEHGNGWIPEQGQNGLREIIYEVTAELDVADHRRFERKDNEYPAYLTVLKDKYLYEHPVNDTYSTREEDYRTVVESLVEIGLGEDETETIDTRLSNVTDVFGFGKEEHGYVDTPAEAYWAWARACIRIWDSLNEADSSFEWDEEMLRRIAMAKQKYREHRATLYDEMQDLGYSKPKAKAVFTDVANDAELDEEDRYDFETLSDEKVEKANPL